ncbi:MAG: AMP-binding protein [candidate division NC10 bacterium]|nr:AMP-binding protein [candidate division NC10 bacterium]
MSLFSAFEAVAARQPDRLALQIKEATGYRRLTYGVVARQARTLAAALGLAGARPGDRVALVSENRPEWTVAYFAVAAAGATAVPLDVQLSDAEVANVLRHAGCRMAIASGKQAPRLLGVDAGGAAPLRVVDLDAEGSGDRVLAFRAILREAGASAPPSLPSVQDDALASILYTSGTTGTPKGVMLSHSNFLANARSILDFGLVNAEDNLLALLPLHHAFPFMVQLILLYSGAHLTFLASLKAPDLLACMQETGVTLLVGVPQLFYMLHKGIFDEIGRRPLPLRFLMQWLLRLSGALRPLGINLGRIVFAPVHRKFGGRIHFMASGGARLDPVIARDFLALGFTMTEGYGLTETGDLGVLSADGYLTITGRAKEVIALSSGKNIYPEEVEEQYLKSPYIEELCLIPQASDRAGATVEGLLALVLPDLDTFRAQGMTNVFETIRWDMENVGRDLPPYKRPTGLVIVKEGFPRTRLGKIQRHLVQQQFQAERAKEAGPAEAPLPETEAALVEDEVGRRVLEYLREATQKPAVRLDDNLELDLGMDSLARVEMLVALEGMFDVKIPDEAAAECFTVREVIERLQTLRGVPVGPPGPSRRRGWGEILTASRLAEVQAMVEASSRPSASVITAISRGMCAALFKSVYRLRVEGLQHVPSHGPMILVANHCSFFDAFILAVALPYRTSQQVFYLGFEWFFRHPLLARWGRGVRVIPVDMDTYLVRALQASALVLKQGRILCVFPEGERSVDGRVRPFRKGVGILVKELKVPVLPAYISGSFETWPRGQSLPRIHRIGLRFGPVATPEALLSGDGPRGADDFETIVMRLRERVIALGGKT